VLALLHDAFAYMRSRIDPPSSLYSLDVDSLKAKGEEEHVVIATSGDDLVGCAFGRELDDALYVGKVAVDSRLRGCGVAREMIAILERLALAQGRIAIELETRVELIENHEAFARLGFCKIGENSHAGYSRPTSIVMRKSLV